MKLTSLLKCAAVFGAMAFTNVMAEEVATIDYITMKDGKVMMVKKDVATELTEPYTFKNGTTIQVNGQYSGDDKKVVTLVEGQK
ncbi:MAG: DUF6799 domain-containing protein, partial [Chthoniobacterales bacterium]